MSQAVVVAVEPSLPEEIRILCTAENVAILQGVLRYIMDLDPVRYHGFRPKPGITFNCYAEQGVNIPGLAEEFSDMVRVMQSVAEGSSGYGYHLMEKPSLRYPVTILRAVSAGGQALLDYAEEWGASERDKEGIRKHVIESVQSVLSKIIGLDQRRIKEWSVGPLQERIGKWVKSVQPTRALGKVESGLTTTLQYVLQELSDSGKLTCEMHEAFALVQERLSVCMTLADQRQIEELQWRRNF